MIKFLNIKEVPVPMTWTPLQDVIDAMPTFEISS